MQNAAQSFIETLQSQIVEIDAQVAPLLEKRKIKAQLANATASDAGLPLPYPDADATTPTPGASAQERVAPDHYTGMKMATACREIMQKRKARGLGAVSVEELYTQLKAGGYPFRAIGKENAVTSLSTTLGKNMQFRRVPGNASLWGLAEWYGAVPRRKSASTEDDDGEAEAGTEEAPEGAKQDSPAAPMQPEQ